MLAETLSLTLRGLTLTDSVLWSLRQQAADRGDCEVSRLCSAALWGTNAEKAQAKRKIKALLAAGAV